MSHASRRNFLKFLARIVAGTITFGENFVFGDTLKSKGGLTTKSPYNASYLKQLHWECNANACDCVDDYLGYPQKPEVKPHIKPISEAELLFRFSNLPFSSDLPPQQKLSLAEIAKWLNISFVVHHFNQRKLVFALISQNEYKHYTKRVYVTKDSKLGIVNRHIYLTPKDGNGNVLKTFPVILACHGHGTHPEIILRDMDGKNFPKRGFGIMIGPSIKGLCLDKVEFETTKSLLLKGTPRMGIHTIEGMISLKLAKDLYWKEQKQGDPKIFLLGNSFGSDLVKILSFFEPAARAVVIDNISRYGKRTDNCDDLSAEYCPELYLRSNSLIAGKEPASAPTIFTNGPLPVPTMQLPGEGVDPNSGHGSYFDAICGFFNTYI